MAPRAVNFLVGWSSGDTNTINVSGLFSVSKSGGGTQTVTRNVTRGTVYSVSSSGSGPGSTRLRIGGFGRLELDDRGGAGGDGDYNDLTILPDRGGFQNASGSSAQYYWAPPSQLPTVGFYLNGTNGDIAITDGDNVNIVWETSSNDIFAPEVQLLNQEGGLISTAQSGGITRSPSATRYWTLVTTNDLGTVTVNRTVTVYPKPAITSFTISNSNPLQGQTYTLNWTTTGANNVTLTQGPSAPGTVATSGSYSIVAGNGGTYTYKLTALNPLDVKVESTVSLTIRDETPNAFEWTTSDSNKPDEQRESNTITINGFSPTQYVDNKLPIKSNYPIQVMINGDGIWRDVQQI